MAFIRRYPPFGKANFAKCLTVSHICATNDRFFQMIHRISTRNKLLLAFGLNTFFYPVVMYVNLDAEHRLWHVIFGDLFPTLFSEYIISSLIIFGWLFLAERFIDRFSKPYRYMLKNRDRPTEPLKAEQLEKENLLSQFSVLKSQVNPHFLFNCLSILSSLVKKDPDLSEQFIDRLSRAYRYILEQRETDVVPLATELEFLQSYTFLLQTRFNNKFEVQVDMDKNTIETSRIPPLTLQILIENAVKHNRMSEREPLIIRIERNGDLLTVRNKFRPRGEEVCSTGVGLQNIINRYTLLTDQPVWAGECEDEFVVKVPVLT